MRVFLFIKLILIWMSSKQNQPNHVSPSAKKRVRICSLNNQKRKALTECTLDLNVMPTSPSEASHSPKLINFSKRRTFETQIDQNEDLQPKQRKIKAKTRQSEEVPTKNTTEPSEFEKLIEITSRCVDYYNKFIQIKDSQLKVVKEAFVDIHESLNKAFNGIIAEVKTKHQEIKQFLDKKQKELIKIKEDQEAELNANLNDVKSVHLMNLLSDYKCADPGSDLSEEICNYAGTLHKFYAAMENVERQNFKQGVEETINFINNIISEEIKFIIYEKIPSKSLNGSFSFNDGLGFGNSITSAIEHKISLQNNSFQPSIVSENLDQILPQKSSGRKKEMKQGWTQTLNQDYQPKQSMLEALNSITKRQMEMKEKIQRYKGIKN